MDFSSNTLQDEKRFLSFSYLNDILSKEISIANNCVITTFDLTFIQQFGTHYYNNQLLKHKRSVFMKRALHNIRTLIEIEHF